MKIRKDSSNNWFTPDGDVFVESEDELLDFFNQLPEGTEIRVHLPDDTDEEDED